MFYTTIIFFFLATSCALVASLKCYSTKQVINVNYTVTSDRVPSFSDCDLVEASQCTLSITWRLNNDTTDIVLSSIPALSTNNAAEDLVIGMAFMDIGPDKITPLLAHNLYFSCTSGDKCNDEDGLKKFLRAATIKDTLREELSSLIKVVSPFDPKSADCVDIKSTVGYCPPKDLTNCQRCQISIDELLTTQQQICATCPQYTMNTNVVTHSTTFLLKERRQLSDHVQVNCQLRGCNSVDNANRVSRSSKITFNFDEYFKN
jgi:hypothetical protein